MFIDPTLPLVGERSRPDPIMYLHCYPFVDFQPTFEEQTLDLVIASH